jgi:hypothetical protein
MNFGGYMPELSPVTPSLPTIAVLGGTGKEGPGLALRLAHAGYPVIIGSRQLEKAQATATELNARLVALGRTVLVSGKENAGAVRQADICILTVVQSAHRAALEGLKDVLQGKILVDATARVDFRDPKPPPPPPAARQAQDILGTGVRVVAAFQNVPAHALKVSPETPLHTDVLVCADDPGAADLVIELAHAIGMQAYYAGDLDNAVVVEGLTSILISLNKRYGVKTASINVSGLEAA